MPRGTTGPCGVPGLASGMPQPMPGRAARETGGEGGKAEWAGVRLCCRLLLLFVG